MELFYYRDPEGNFGDDLNEWMWEELLPGMWDDTDDISFCGIGTIIDFRMAPDRTWIVFSSGVGYKALPVDFGGPNWNIVSVRGPLTAEVLGVSDSKAVTDGAILLHLLPEGTPLAPDEREGIVFVPHQKAAQAGLWTDACEKVGIHCLDHTADLLENLNRLRRAKLVLADAMHGAIVADTLRVPWVPLMTSKEINSFKWLDWTESMNVPYKPTDLCGSSAHECLRRIRFSLNSGFAISNPNREAAIKDYQKRVARSNAIRTVIRKMFTGCFYMIRAFLFSRPMSGIRKRLNEMAIERAAVKLIEVSKLPSYLSEDRIFQARVDEMERRLSEVPILVENLKHPE